MAEQKQFLNSIFADRKNGQYGEYFDLHITNVESFINNLRAFGTNSKGGLRFRMSGKKDNQNEMTIYLNAWEPGQNQPIPERTAPPVPQQAYTGPVQGYGTPPQQTYQKPATGLPTTGKGKLPF